MDTLITTLIFAFILIVAAFAALGIGWLITGKSRIVSGACGRAPTRKRDDACGADTTCSLCHKEENKENTTQK